jgi:spore germination protein KB
LCSIVRGVKMTNHEITSKQMQAIFILFWAGSAVVTGINPDAKQDSWISILFAGIMILPLLALYVRIIKLYPGLNLFEIVFKIFGNIFGRIISSFFVLYFIHLGGMVTIVFTSFVQILNMPETPELLMTTFIVLLASWSAKNGPENIGRLSKFIWPLVAVSIGITFIVAIKNMDINYIKPIMETNFKSLLSAAFNFSALPLAEIVLCICFFSSVNTKAKPAKIFTKSLISFIILMLAIVFRNILVLGIPTALIFYHPSYQSVSIISVGDFFTHIEVLIGINLLLAGFIKVTVCLYASSLGISKILNISDQKTIIVPCALLINTITGMLYSNPQANLMFIKVYPFYFFPIQVILPFIIWIGAEIQSKINTAGAQSKAQ